MQQQDQRTVAVALVAPRQLDWFLMPGAGKGCDGQVGSGEWRRDVRLPPGRGAGGDRKRISDSAIAAYTNHTADSRDVRSGNVAAVGSGSMSRRLAPIGSLASLPPQ